MTNSRDKGKRGELELAAALTLLTGAIWRRTAQRCGLHKGDVEADNCTVHVECKRYKDGLARALKALDKAQAAALVTPNAIICRLDKLGAALGPVARGSTVHALRTPSLLHLALIQAERDRHSTYVPFVCAREDHGPWMACWSPRDTEQLRKRMGELMAKAT